MKDLKIGVIVADSDEYLPLASSIADKKEYKYFNRNAIAFDLNNYTVICINCGIGKVNAATAATHLADIGCTYVLNYGLSGGISGVKRGEIVLPDKFLEHDFDLTGIGYKPCEKPSQKYIYDADAMLLVKAQMAVGECKHGTAVCGDRFICNAEDRDFLREMFSATTCDMETAAIASVCDMAGIPYLSLRRVSDDAGEDAYANYSDMNTMEGLTLSQVFFNVLTAICKEVDL